MLKVCSLILLMSSMAQADCLFKVINYSRHEVSAKLGFYGESAVNVRVAPASTAMENISSKLKCNAVTDFGSGRVFIQFPRDPALAGANYAPASNSVNLMGRLAGSSQGRLLSADDGAELWLTTDGRAIDDTKFEVVIKRPSQVNSRVAGTN